MVNIKVRFTVTFCHKPSVLSLQNGCNISTNERLFFLHAWSTSWLHITATMGENAFCINSWGVNLHWAITLQTFPRTYDTYKNGNVLIHKISNIYDCLVRTYSSITVNSHYLKPIPFYDHLLLKHHTLAAIFAVQLCVEWNEFRIVHIEVKIR